MADVDVILSTEPIANGFQVNSDVVDVNGIPDGIHENGIHENGVHENGVHENGVLVNGVYENGLNDTNDSVGAVESQVEPQAESQEVNGDAIVPASAEVKETSASVDLKKKKKKPDVVKSRIDSGIRGRSRPPAKAGVEEKTRTTTTTKTGGGTTLVKKTTTMSKSVPPKTASTAKPGSARSVSATKPTATKPLTTKTTSTMKTTSTTKTTSTRPTSARPTSAKPATTSKPPVAKTATTTKPPSSSTTKPPAAGRATSAPKPPTSRPLSSRPASSKPAGATTSKPATSKPTTSKPASTRPTSAPRTTSAKPTSATKPTSSTARATSASKLTSNAAPPGSKTTTGTKVSPASKSTTVKPTTTKTAPAKPGVPKTTKTTPTTTKSKTTPTKTKSPATKTDPSKPKKKTTPNSKTELGSKENAAKHETAEPAAAVATAPLPDDTNIKSPISPAENSELISTSDAVETLEKVSAESNASAEIVHNSQAEAEALASLREDMLGDVKRDLYVADVENSEDVVMNSHIENATVTAVSQYSVTTVTETVTITDNETTTEVSQMTAELSVESEHFSTESHTSTEKHIATEEHHSTNGQTDHYVTTEVHMSTEDYVKSGFSENAEGQIEYELISTEVKSLTDETSEDSKSKEVSTDAEDKAADEVSLETSVSAENNTEDERPMEASIDANDEIADKVTLETSFSAENNIEDEQPMEASFDAEYKINESTSQEPTGSEREVDQVVDDEVRGDTTTESPLESQVKVEAQLMTETHPESESEFLHDDVEGEHVSGELSLTSEDKTTDEMTVEADIKHEYDITSTLESQADLSLESGIQGGDSEKFCSDTEKQVEDNTDGDIQVKLGEKVELSLELEDKSEWNISTEANQGIEETNVSRDVFKEQEETNSSSPGEHISEGYDSGAVPSSSPFDDSSYDTSENQYQIEVNANEDQPASLSPLKDISVENYSATMEIAEDGEGYTGTSMIGAMFLQSSEQEDSYDPSYDAVACSTPGVEIELKGNCEDEDNGLQDCNTETELFVTEDDNAADADTAMPVDVHYPDLPTSAGYCDKDITDVQETSTTDVVDLIEQDNQETVTSDDEKIETYKEEFPSLSQVTHVEINYQEEISTSVSLPVGTGSLDGLSAEGKTDDLDYQEDLSNKGSDISYDQEQQEQKQEDHAGHYEFVIKEQERYQPEEHGDEFSNNESSGATFDLDQRQDLQQQNSEDDEEKQVIQNIDTVLADHITDDLTNGQLDDVNVVASNSNQSDGIFLMSRLNGSEEDDTTDESESSPESTSPTHYITTTTTTTTATTMEMGQSESNVHVGFAWKGDEFSMTTSQLTDDGMITSSQMDDITTMADNYPQTHEELVKHSGGGFS